MLRCSLLLWAILFTLPACSGSTAPVAKDLPPNAPPPEAPAETGEQGAQAALPLGKVTLEAPPRAPITLSVEVASTPQEQQRGLMFRKSLASDAGMFFVFPSERHQAFWMHNTLIPLDMFFIGADMNVIGVVENATPLTDDAREVAGNSQYVLEVNAGFAKQHGFGPGTKVIYTPPEGT